MKIKKEFIGFQKSNKYLFNDKYNRLIINNNKPKKFIKSDTRKLSSFGINTTTNYMFKENSFNRNCFRNINNNFNLYKTNKKFSLNKNNKNIFIDPNIINDNIKCKTTRIFSENKDTPVKSLSQKKLNNFKHSKLFSSFYPCSKIRKNLDKNFNIIISHNNKDKTNKNNNSVEYGKNSINRNNNIKKLCSFTNSSNSIEVTDKNENEFSSWKNKGKINFYSTIKKGIFNNKMNKNKGNNIKKEYIKALSYKVLKKKLSELKIIGSKKEKNRNNEELRNEKNDLDIFIRILNIHIKIEKVLIKNKENNIICIDIEKNNKLIISKVLIELINNFFETLKNVNFDIDFFIEINKNRLIRKTIKILISFYSLFLILLKLTNIESAIKELSDSETFYQISKILYNLFEYYILPDLHYNNCSLRLINSFKEIANKNKYIIKKEKNNDIILILFKKIDKCLDTFKEKINEKIKEEQYINLNPVFNCIISMLININTKSILAYIDNTINVILYSLLDKNVNHNIIYSDNNDKYKINDSAPYLPSIDHNYKYTLVLDMDETLIHFLYQNKTNNNIFNFNMMEQNDLSKVGMFLLRPYAKYFIEKLKDLYEIIIFTNGTKIYCDKIIDLIDPKRENIKYRLYRSHSINKDNDIYLKDLSLLGRDLSKIIIIDDLKKNYKLQEDNGLPITSWMGNLNDTELKDLIPVLRRIVIDEVEDTRKIIIKIKKILSNKNTDSYYSIIDNINDIFINEK
jgi:Dullard-like phosphatase family protein